MCHAHSITVYKPVGGLRDRLGPRIPTDPQTVFRTYKFKHSYIVSHNASFFLLPGIEPRSPDLPARSLGTTLRIPQALPIKYSAGKIQTTRIRLQ
jgi:hypothetical protein